MASGCESRSQEYDLIEYMSGLTVFVLDKSVLKAVALERGVLDKGAGDLSQKERDLLRADILMRVYNGPGTIASFSRQHGQFSTTTGQQTINNRQALLDSAAALYRKWDDPMLDFIDSGSVQWVF